MTIKVEVFSSPGCSKCGHAKEILRKTVKEFGDDRIEWREVNILKELDYAVQMGVLSTPAIAIDGKLVYSGLPSAGKLKILLEEKLIRTGTEIP
ncbi:MAG TPA: glutaredoxin [Candidatus Marinimicrobia bacterium]|nr:glutaredoxin [Candidatus Neomarinimicrobiota bacterium]